MRGASQHAGPQVQFPLVAAELTQAQVERLIVDEQADDLAVGDVDHGLARLGIAVAGLGVGHRALLVEAGEVGARQAGRLALVEVSAQANVTVGQREQRFRLIEYFQVEVGLAQRPRLDRKGGVEDHGASSS